MARDRLPSVVSRWYGQWCMADGQGACEVKCMALDGAVEQSPAPPWQKARAGAGSISLAGDWQTLVFGPFSREMPLDETAQHLLCEAQRTLIGDVLEALGQGSISSLETAPSGPSGGLLNAQVLLEICVGQASVLLLLDAILLNVALTPWAPREPLVERKQALGKAKVKLSVRLPLASLSIGEMNDLHPGDTLRSRGLLTDPVSLQIDEGPVVAGGYLARQQGHLAVQLISIG
ncbi:FliM/FliN family flagellar motor C-terminal domain-containing protein [Pseudomonas gingeri]|nr:FliM/FliN family flagellar motor C-terminal domain-containing protein [Pseudomonas gingeri]